MSEMAAIRKKSVQWAMIWIGLGLALGLWVAATRGRSAAEEYYAAYAIEESLSIDNMFVFLIIFSHLQIPEHHQHRVLGYGVAGALISRALLIAAGISLIQRFHWMIYPFSALILFAAWRMLFGQEPQRSAVASSCNACKSWIARIVPVDPGIHGNQFWRRDSGRLVATPLFVALVIIETTDVVFALDSIPSVLAVSHSPLVVYSSNIMAMLGMRSLYFVLADAIEHLRYLRQGLATILIFTGTKMLISQWIEISPGVSLVVIACVLLITVIASIRVRE